MLLRCHPLTASHAISRRRGSRQVLLCVTGKGLVATDGRVPASRTGHAILASGLRYPIGPVGGVWHVHSCPSSRLTRLFGTVPLVPTIRTCPVDTQKARHITRPTWLHSDHADDSCGQAGRDGWYSRRSDQEATLPGESVYSALAAGYLTSAAVARNSSASRPRRPWRGRIRTGPAGPRTSRVSAMQARCPVYPVESDCPPRWSHQGDTCATKQSDC